MSKFHAAAALAGLLLGASLLGCGASPPPVAKPGPPAPPPPPVVVAPTPAPPVVPTPMPVTLPPELIAKADELIKLMKPLPATGDALDQVAAISEQQAKVVAVYSQLSALLNKLTPEQKVEFDRRYQEQMAAAMQALVPAAPATPPANP